MVVANFNRFWMDDRQKMQEKGVHRQPKAGVGEYF